MARCAARVSEWTPALWRLAAASLIDEAPGFALTLVPVFRALSAADPLPGAADEPDAEQGTFRARAPEVARRAGPHLLAYGWLQLALISTFGRTPGMALVGLKLVRSGGASIGITGAFARAFGPNYLIRALTTPLRADRRSRSRLGNVEPGRVPRATYSGTDGRGDHGARLSQGELPSRSSFRRSQQPQRTG